MPKKLIFIVVGLVLIAELIWGVWNLTKKSSQTQVQQPTVQHPVIQSTIVLKASKNSYKIGENIAVTIDLSSQKPTDGTDVIIVYDPKKLQVVPASAKTPVAVGNLYNNYPLNKVDEATGRISISGITSQTNGVIAKGVFGTINFKAIAAGPAKIMVDFTPGSTVDSNIIETKTAKDILSGVNNLEINLTP